jgi:hypothetical protein
MIIQRIIAHTGIEGRLSPRVGAGSTATSNLALSIGLVDVAERIRRARLADRAANTHRGGAGQEAPSPTAPRCSMLYDLSSSYMEGRWCSLAKPGYSRDHRPELTWSQRRHELLSLLLN